MQSWYKGLTQSYYNTLKIDETTHSVDESAPHTCALQQMSLLLLYTLTYIKQRNEHYHDKISQSHQAHRNIEPVERTQAHCVGLAPRRQCTERTQWSGQKHHSQPPHTASALRAYHRRHTGQHTLWSKDGVRPERCHRHSLRRHTQFRPQNALVRAYWCT